MFDKKSMVLAAALFAASAHAGIHGAGNGGDGLELTNAPATENSNEIIVPDDQEELPGYGSLEVEGKAGSEGDGIEVKLCRGNPRVEPVKYACDQDYTTWGLNGPALALQSGAYRVSHGNTVEFTQVLPGKKTILKLLKIQIPRAANFSVFYDYTDPSMQDFLLRRAFVIPGPNYDVDQQFCTKPAPQDEAACQAMRSNDYRALRKIFRFESDGSYSSWAFSSVSTPPAHSFVNSGRDYVAESAQGGFVSVFPGVYGIALTDRSGKTSTVYGIKAKP